MNTAHHRDGRFEERLLAELRGVVEERTMEPPELRSNPVRPPGVLARSRRFGTLVAAGGVVAVSGLVVIPVLTGSTGASPAYAVVRQDDGSVTVTINRFEDAHGLERKLEANGIPAEVNDRTAEETRRCPTPWLPPGKVMVTPLDPGGATYTVQLSDFTGDETLVIWGSEEGDRRSVDDPDYSAHDYVPNVAVAPGPVAELSCVPIDVTYGDSP